MWIQVSIFFDFHYVIVKVFDINIQSHSFKVEVMLIFKLKVTWIFFTQYSIFTHI